MYTVYLVEDDPVIADVVAARLRQWGMAVAVAADFADVTGEFVRLSPQLVLLDVGLPCFSGYHWCTEIRRLSKVPILFLSSASDNLNMVMAMQMGADDFIAKPFDLDVLTVKIQALLRRTYDFQGQAAFLEHRGAVLRLDDATLHVAGVQIDLTRNEFRILQVLLENKGRIVSRDELMKHLWESDAFVDDNTLTVNVARLRRKLEDAGLPGFIGTKKGAGYLVEDR